MTIDWAASNNGRNLFAHSSGEETSQIQVSAGLVPSEASLLAPGGRFELWPFLGLSVDVPVPSPSPSSHGGLFVSPPLCVFSPLKSTIHWIWGQDQPDNPE